MTTTPAESASNATDADAGRPEAPGRDAVLLVADHVAGVLLVMAVTEGGSDGKPGGEPRAEEVARLTGCHLSEHAGFLALPDGRVACVDERAGELLLLDPLATLTGRSMPVTRVSVAVPAEQLAADPDGRYLVVGTGLGLNDEPWNDLLTVVDTTVGRGVRVRTRADEPGVGVVGGEHFPDGAPRLVVRRRAPGSLDLHRLDDLWTAPTGSPRVEPIDRIPLPDDGLGDADDPSDPTVARVLTACGDGVHRARVAGDRLVAEPPLPWVTAGRGHYLRPEPGTDRVWSVVRGGPAEPTAWPEWTNTAWCRHTAVGRTDLTDLGPGLVFRAAFAAPGVAAFSRVHPDGDELVLLPTRSADAGGAPPLPHRIPLPAMDGAPRRGGTPWDGVQRRAIAASPARHLVAVSRGGHGTVHLVDVREPERRVDLVLDTPLDEGGRLCLIAPGDGAHLDRRGR